MGEVPQRCQVQPCPLHLSPTPPHRTGHRPEVKTPCGAECLAHSQSSAGVGSAASLCGHSLGSEGVESGCRGGSGPRPSPDVLGAGRGVCPLRKFAPSAFFSSSPYMRSRGQVQSPPELPP